MQNKTKGLVLGKFMPLHQGHVLLLQFARQFVDELIVVVDKVVNEPIPGIVRKKWIQEIFPQIKIICLDETTPQTPEEHPNFWQYWQDLLNRKLQINPDLVFASEDYGVPLADRLGAKYIPFDPERKLIDISGKALRNNFFDKWQYLASSVKKDLVFKISLFGPESTGKSTLASQLAAHYQTVMVPEYARTIIESREKIEKEDMVLIAKGQKILEDNACTLANSVLICDTDPLLTSIWHQFLFQENSPEIIDIARTGHYHLTLLTDIDLAWVADKARYLPNNRVDFLNCCINTLNSHNRNYALIKGKGNARLKNAIMVIDEMFKQFKPF